MLVYPLDIQFQLRYQSAFLLIILQCVLTSVSQCMKDAYLLYQLQHFMK